GAGTCGCACKAFPGTPGRGDRLVSRACGSARRVNRHGAAGSVSTLGAMFISERRRRRRRPLIIAAVLLGLAGAALAAFLILNNRTDDVHRGDEVEFSAPPPRPKVDDTVDWPVYHYDSAHTGYLPAKVGPPFKERWLFSGKVLMEFPPIVVDGSVYFMRNNGGTYRLDADTGKVKWKNQIGKLSATSPAYWRGRLFVTSLSGKLTALRARNGK